MEKRCFDLGFYSLFPQRSFNSESMEQKRVSLSGEKEGKTLEGGGSAGYIYGHTLAIFIALGGGV